MTTHLALLVRRVAVDAAVLVLAHDHEVLEDVEHLGHLREDEHAVAAVLGEGGSCQSMLKSEKRMTDWRCGALS